MKFGFIMCLLLFTQVGCQPIYEKIVEKGNTYVKNFEFEKGLVEYEKAVKINSKDAQLYYNFCHTYWELGNKHRDKKFHNKAIDYCDKSLEVDPDFAKPYFHLGIINSRLGNTYKAKKLVRKSKELFKAEGDINGVKIAEKMLESMDRKTEHRKHANRALAYADKGKFEEAIVEFKKLLEINPNNSAAHYNLGITYRKSGQFENAIDSYKKALQINPRDEDAWIALGVAYSFLRKHQDAISCYLKALEICPDDALAYYNLGLRYYALRQNKKAKESFLKAKELYQKEGDKEQLVKVEKYLNKLFNAEKTLEAIDGDSQDFKHLQQGFNYSEKGEYEKAIVEYKKSLEIDPNSSATHYNLGITYRRLGQFENAIDSYKKALQIDPRDEDAWVGLGNAYSSLRKYQDALSCYLKALEICPDDALAYYNLGLCYYALGQNKKAKESLLKAKELYQKEGDKESPVELEKYLNYLNELFNIEYDPKLGEIIVEGRYIK